jgi:hypothetical protein
MKEAAVVTRIRDLAAEIEETLNHDARLGLRDAGGAWAAELRTIADQVDWIHTLVGKLDAAIDDLGVSIRH